MKLFERFLGEADPLGKLHKDFHIKYGPWRYNRRYEPFEDRGIILKIRFGFDDPSLLNHCPFMAKIGDNRDPVINNRYIGFAYGKEDDRASIQQWARRFPYAELIEGLDQKGVSHSSSRRESLQENAG